MEYADHPNVGVCWNSNPSDVTADGTIAPNFKLVAGKIREVHLRDLTDEKYPWRELFRTAGRVRLRRATPWPRSRTARTRTGS